MDDRVNPSPGVRHRFHQPAAPAPVPDAQPPRPKKKKDENDRSLLQAPAGAPRTAHGLASGQAAGAVDVDKQSEGTSDTDVVRSTGSMAIATLFSRITGFLRNVLIVTTLGPAISSAFNVANTLPNLITEIVLGAVLTSLVVPVLVRAEKEDPDRGERFIRQLFTLATTLLGVITLVSVAGAPLLTRLMLSSEGKVNLTQSTGFAYLLLPQIIFYGLFALLMAVLNTKNVFKPGAWAPVINNIIVLAVLVAYKLVPGELSPSDPAGVTDPHVLLLGVGTTLGVVVQMLIMVPPIRRAGVSLKPLWGIDDRLKQFGGMALAIVVYVAISQFGYTITTRIASTADDAAPNIYQQAWLLLQVPYGIIGVTLLTAIMPRLSRNAADGDDKAVVGDLVLGSKLTFLALIPIVVFFTAFGTPIATGLFAYGAFPQHTATILGMTLSFSAFTLLPYAMVLLHLRVFYAREDAWTPTFIIAGITITKVLLSWLAPAVASSPEDVVILLGAANGFGFVAGALIGAFLLRRKLGSLGTRTIAHTSLWALGASIVGVVVSLVLAWLLNRVSGPLFSIFGSAGHLVHLAIVGVVFLGVTGYVLSRSGLPEVGNIGRALTRIPGMSRIIKVGPPVGAEESAASTEARVYATAEALAYESEFNASPVPPPMSAGVVRGPRLVPGAEVSDGRFRLLADHGSVPGARFWQAREKATGREVSLTFVDTTGSAPQAPATPQAAALEAESIAARTRALAALHHEAVASNIEVLSYRTGALVVADWVPGRSLASVATMHPDPQAAAGAFVPLADAVTTAHAHHTLLGLDNRARLRISTAGVATLAFPAVLSDASEARDLRGIRAGLASLVDAEGAPSQVRELLESEPSELPAALLALGGLGGGTETAAKATEEPIEQGTAAPDESPALEITEEKTPKPTSTPGFGRAGYSRGGLGILAAAAIAIVIAVALITTYLASLFSSSDDSAPLGSDTVVGSSSAAPGVQLIQPIASVSVWAPDMTAVDAQSQAAGPLAADGDATTGWALRAGEGLVLRIANAAQLTSVVIHTETTASADVKVYGLPEGASDPVGSAGLDELPLLAEKSFDSTQTTVELSDKEPLAGIILLVEPTDATQANSIQEVTLVGK